MTYYKSINPATGETLQEFAAAADEEISGSLKKAQTAYDSWRQTAVPERTAVLLRVAELYRDRRDELARIISLEMSECCLASCRGTIPTTRWPGLPLRT